MENLEDLAHEMKGETVIFEKDGEIAIKDKNGNVVFEKDTVESRLAGLLCEFTEIGQAKWIGCKVDPNWFYCFVNKEKIKVEVVIDDDDDGINCLEKSFIVFMIHYRDAEFMYCGDVYNGDKIIEILKSVTFDDEQFEKLNQSWFKHWESHLLDDLSNHRNSSLKPGN